MNALKRNYHWVIALTVFLEMILFGGFINALGVFTIPITESLGITRGNYSVLSAVRSFSGFFSTLLTGFLFHKFGYRRCLLTSLVLFAGGLAMLGFAQTPVMLAMGYGLLGASYGACSTTGVVRVIKSWFHKHQGLLLGVVTMATGLGGSLMSVVLTKIILASSWRYAFFFTALLAAGMVVLCLGIRDEPSQMNLRPYGDAAIPQKRQKAKQSYTEWPGHTLGEIVREPQFYLMILCILGACICIYLTFNTLVAHLQDMGRSPEEAAAFYSLLMLVLSGVKMAGGWLIDRIGAKWVTVLCCVCTAIGQFIFAEAANPILNYIGLVAFSVGLLFTTILVPMLAMPLFGYRAFGTINGIFMAMISLAGMVGTPIADLLYDRIGSYTPVYKVGAAVSVGMVGLYSLLFWLCEREKKHFLATQKQAEENFDPSTV